MRKLNLNLFALLVLLESSINIHPSGFLTGFKVYKVENTRLEEVEPRNCGPFLHWNLEKFPDGKIPYYINRFGSKDLSINDIKKAAEESFQAWRESTGVALDFKFVGLTNVGTNIEAIGKGKFKHRADHMNVIAFDESGAFFDNIGKPALGFTPPLYDESTGEIFEADILLNGSHIPSGIPFWNDWIASQNICSGIDCNVPINWNLQDQHFDRLLGGPIVRYHAYLKSTLTHEIGHFLGFGHSMAVGATMSTEEISKSFPESTDQSTLEDDDRNAARFLYPADMRVVSEPVEPRNVALGRPVRVTTNGANDPCNYCEKDWSDITDSRFDYVPNGDGHIKDGVVGWQNNDYNQMMEVTVTIDLGYPVDVTKIRYATGNLQRVETWNADSMISPFGTTGTNPGRNHIGVWTEHNGRTRTSKIDITFQKTRRKWEEDWLFIGEIEVIGTPVEDYRFSSSRLPQQGTTNTWTGNVNPRLCWQDTGMNVTPGQTIDVTASGTVTWDPNIRAVVGTVGPNGSGYPASRIANVRHETFPVKTANTGSLLMRVGNADNAPIYAVGKNSRYRVEQSGNVQFMINDEPEWLFDNSGRFFVKARKE